MTGGAQGPVLTTDKFRLEQKGGLRPHGDGCSNYVEMAATIKIMIGAIKI